MFLRLTLLLGCCGMAISQLNCDSLLRNIYPQWFTHCDCSYSQWSEWKFVADSVVDVPTSQCSTGQAYSESFTRSAVGEGCISETETRVICKFLTPLSLIIYLCVCVCANNKLHVHLYRFA